MTETYIPPEAQELLDEIGKIEGVHVEWERLSSTSGRVTATTDRVTAVGNLQAKRVGYKGRRVIWMSADGELAIDGTARIPYKSTAEDWYAFLRCLAEPETDRPLLGTKQTASGPMSQVEAAFGPEGAIPKEEWKHRAPRPADTDEPLPAFVEAKCRKLARSVAKDPTMDTLAVGKVDGEWVAVISNDRFEITVSWGDGRGAAFRGHRVRSITWMDICLDGAEPLRITENIDTLLDMIMSRSAKRPDVPGTVGRSQSAERPNSVMVRKNTVIRV